MNSKKCTKCKIEKLITEFQNHSCNKNGLSSQCKSCLKAYKYANKERISFQDKKYSERHKDQIAERGKQYRAKNAEHRKNLAADYRAKKKKEIDAYEAARRVSHKSRIQETKRKFNKNNKHRLNAWCAARRAAKLKRTPSWADKSAIAFFYATREWISNETGILHHVDHAIPLRGKNVSGLHVHTNLRITTAVENLKKGNDF